MQSHATEIKISELPLLDVIQAEFGSKYSTVHMYVRDLYKNKIYPAGNEQFLKAVSDIVRTTMNEVLNDEVATVDN